MGSMTDILRVVGEHGCVIEHIKGYLEQHHREIINLNSAVTHIMQTQQHLNEEITNIKQRMEEMKHTSQNPIVVSCTSEGSLSESFQKVRRDLDEVITKVNERSHLIPWNMESSYIGVKQTSKSSISWFSKTQVKADLETAIMDAIKENNMMMECIIDEKAKPAKEEKYAYTGFLDRLIFEQNIDEKSKRVAEKIKRVIEKNNKMTEQNIQEKIEESEQNMEEKITKSEQNMKEKIRRSEDNMEEKIEENTQKMENKIEEREQDMEEKIEENTEEIENKIEESEENMEMKIRKSELNMEIKIRISELNMEEKIRKSEQSIEERIRKT
ncbi:hypothetical protein NDU88_011742 [Pleurodeles waltl]|uniref:Uncharacterized protein n=1 Tax=Pleurodeles waltl TaxID=8319 RepID=A0AAV7QYK8_PLEWA|nr:hypothetical protein NDU88_011742 [Pleurodeles waltl]